MMALKRKPYFYDNQLKRLLLQIMACFAGYQVRTGNQRDGKHRFLDVPIIYGDMQQTVGYILQGGGGNTTSYIPIMSLIMTNLKQKAAWRQNPQHSEKYNFIERAMTPDGVLLVNQPGMKKTVERYMPVPYDVTIDLAIWASNQDQGLQLVEQIATVFNPDMDIQLSNSPADWTFLTSLLFQGDVKMEKVVPSGTEVDPMYTYTLTFDTVIWISPPAKVYETKHIYEIDFTIFDKEDGSDFDEFRPLDGCVIRADEEAVLALESLQPADTSDPDEKIC